VGTDVEARRIDAARQRWAYVPNVQFQVAAAEALPFDDDSFDGVFMNEVLEHVDNEGASLNEIRRVLRPGGTLVLMSPNRFFPFEGHGLQLGAHKVDVPIPLLPWLPGAISRHLMRARNYWPWELTSIVQDHGLGVVGVESVFPVFEIYPWLPRRLQHWYWKHLGRIERAPVIRRFGVSTMVIARKMA
jgi:ubiquinone/menaquinone biosynthesis C-methylase UbiE